jgi:hypothetical protein
MIHELLADEKAKGEKKPVPPERKAPIRKDLRTAVPNDEIEYRHKRQI